MDRSTALSTGNTPGVLVARNAALNLVGRGVPMLIGLFTVPYVVRKLSMESFGLLSLSWGLFAYVSLLDFGLGRAITRTLAQHRAGKGPLFVRKAVWTSSAAQLVVGLTAAAVLAAAAPALVRHGFHAPPQLSQEAVRVVRIIALAVPVVLCSSTFSGVLEAFQRFDLLNFVNVAASSLTFLLPAIAAAVSPSVTPIVALLVIVQFGRGLAYYVLASRQAPLLGRPVAFDVPVLKGMLSFGGWIAASNAIAVVTMYFDRFIVAALLSLASVAQYSGPFDLLMRIMVLPAAASSALFPTLASLASRDPRGAILLSYRTAGYLFAAVASVLGLCFVFAREILQLYMGSRYAAASTAPFRILLLGVLLNALAYIPCCLLQALGRPDIPAKLNIVELAIVIGPMFLMIKRWGIAGAAAAWCMRVALDVLFMLIAMARTTRPLFAEPLKSSRALTTLTLAGGYLIAAGALGCWGPSALGPRIVAWALTFTGLCVLIWNRSLDERSRLSIRAYASRTLRSDSSRSDCSGSFHAS